MKSFIQRFSTSWMWQYLLARHSIWQQLHRVQPHPISAHIQRQLSKYIPLPILSFIIGWGGLIFIITLTLYSRVGTLILLTFPLILMIFSAGYILPWLYRITVSIQDQYHNAVIDTIGVIPEGRIFVIFSICHAIVNDADRLGWIKVIRQFITFSAMSGIIMAIFTTLSLMPTILLVDIIRLFIDLAIVALLLHTEHQQSILTGCYLAVIIPQQTTQMTNIVSTTIISFIILQFISWIVPISILILMIGRTQFPSISFTFIAFLLIREILLYALWKISNAANN